MGNIIGTQDFFSAIAFFLCSSPSCYRGICLSLGDLSRYNLLCKSYRTGDKATIHMRYYEIQYVDINGSGIGLNVDGWVQRGRDERGTEKMAYGNADL